ncbi:LLM class F420-dependent oxidoreductase [Streptomyces spongiae]|uniref:LLM class F420-dependent oxidoreductase n=1 Tax=Streptomyces spongiae TaxID=565072 RepID=A0A5N8XAX6_9ACTN|nr:LLM class F420-dependent oxidoreductase [Streptomyces spongiae]MPY55675.1 LLM class F420-dependent oxidoreductase [Streptomyces spongiae]
MTIRLGCDLPYFEDPSAIRDFAQAAEELGYDTLSFSEHVAVTTDSPFPPGFAFDDPWHESMTLAAYLAGVTSRIEITTSMLLLPLRPTVLAAKQAAEVDLLSGGRLRLAVSLGWNDREVALLGQDPRRRGARLEEQIEVMRLLWSEPSVNYSGTFHDLDGAGIRPRPTRRIPVWMGAGSMASGGVPTEGALRRIARFADGYKMFAPLGLDPAKAHDVVARLRTHVRDAGRPADAVGLEARLLTQAVPGQQWRTVMEEWAEAGATCLGLGNRIVGGTPDEQIAVLTDVMRALRG